MNTLINKNKVIGYSVIICSTNGIAAILVFYFCSYNKTIELKKANMLLESGDFLGARKMYEKILEKQPDNFAAHYGLGMSWSAETIYKTDMGIATTAQDWYYALYHMSIAMNLKEHDQVKKTLAILHFNLGTYFKKTDELDAAIKQIEQAVVYDPGLLKALNLLGALYYERADYSKAEYWYTQALAVKPDYAMAHFNLGAVAWANQDYKRCVSFFTKAVELSPDNQYFKTWLEKANKQIRKQ